MAADTDRVVLLLTIRPSQKTVLALVSPQLHSSVSILISIAGWWGDVSVTLGLADCWLQSCARSWLLSWIRMRRVASDHHLVTITGHGDTLHTHKQHYTGSNRSFPTSLQAEEGGSVTNKQVHKWHNINSNILIQVMLMTHSMFPSSPQDSPRLSRVIVCVTFLAVLINNKSLINCEAQGRKGQRVDLGRSLKGHL